MKNIIYQTQVWDRLIKTFEAWRVGNAYLFAGPEGCGKEGLAIKFAALLNCTGEQNLPCGLCVSCKKFESLQHPNLKIIVPLPGAVKKGNSHGNPLDGLSNKDLEYLTEALGRKGADPFYKIQVGRARRILITSIRELRRTIFLKAHEQGQKTVLIFDAHLLSEGQGESANALLKILEEPPKNTTLILITDLKPNLLPTILSRCQLINFPSLPHETVFSILEQKGFDPEESNFAAGISQGNIHRAFSLADKPKAEIENLTSDLVQQVINETSHSWKSFIENEAMLAFRKPLEFKFHFFLLQLWFHKAMLIKSGVILADTFSAWEDMLIDFNKTYPLADLTAVNGLLEAALDSLNRNLYTPLTLTNLLISIQDCLQGKNALSIL